MNESIKTEFFRWLNTTESTKFSEIEIKLLNLIITHFDSLAPLGTNSGLRAKKFSELIQKHRDTTPCVLQITNTGVDNTAESVGKIIEFEVGPFRGFNSQERFAFDKKYTFLYGPNGSGKSSFCEGLEYALLGEIWEATARRIPLDNYIRNLGKHKATEPAAYYNDNAGQKSKIVKNQELYRFAFIEKNRIDGFARLTSATPNDQKDRIATLFGFDTFNEFVDGFTDDFKYLQTETPKANAFSTALQLRESNNTQIAAIDKEGAENLIALQALISEVDEKTAQDKNTLKLFLVGEDGASGKIALLHEQKAQSIPDNLDEALIDTIVLSVENLQSNISVLNTDIENLNKLSSDLNYKDLYSAIVAIGNTSASDKSVCPACKTPLTQTVVNPFVNSQNELSKLQTLSELQTRIPEEARDIERKVREFRVSFHIASDCIKQVENSSVFASNLTEINYTDIASVQSWLNILSIEVAAIEQDFSKYNELKVEVKKYNETLIELRSEQSKKDDEIAKYTNFNTQLVSLTTTEDRLAKEKEALIAKIKLFDESNEQTLKEIDQEKNIIEFNKRYIEAYNKIIKSLKSYRNSLPALLSLGLSTKTKDYFNIINSHDPDFEKLDDLTLPARSGEKIVVSFSGSTDKYDALHILSEGHIKVLGLSILLAKATDAKLGFIIFDDVVNAIDDDHRNGIAELLIGHADFKESQLIITCHADQFINKLEHELGTSKAGSDVCRYRFYPADSISERGIKMTIGDAKHYLLQAKSALDKDARKEVAAKCRQAVESISQSLWKKMGQKLNISLSVKMRTPNALPDLSSVVDSLIKELKSFGTDSSIYKLFLKLKENYTWSLLNKGTHEQDDLPELDRTDVTQLLDLVNRIEADVKALKITTGSNLTTDRESTLTHDVSEVKNYGEVARVIPIARKSKRTEPNGPLLPFDDAEGKG